MNKPNLYKKIDILILKLRDSGNIKNAEILNHLLHKVAWTTSSELLEKLLVEINNIDLEKMDHEITTLINNIRLEITRLLK
jgi:hypothetical protein